jgi:hypothetical protein
MPPALFALVIFSNRVLFFNQPHTTILLTVAFYVAGITGASPHLFYLLRWGSC